MSNSKRWYKEDEQNQIWWLDNDTVGEWVFSFDKVKEYNLFQDYPKALSDKEIEIFNRECPYWREFFADRF